MPTLSRFAAPIFIGDHFIVGITADTALRLSKYFGTSAKFWLGLQDDYDIEEERNKKSLELEAIVELEVKS